MSVRLPRAARPVRAVPSTRSVRSVRSVAAFSLARACLMACGPLFLQVPWALAFPPFAEEWTVPGQPQDVEVDPAGRVWVSSDDDSIRVYAPTGGELLFAFGGSGVADGEFSTPYGMAFDALGEVYICDYVGPRIQKFTSEGVFLLSWPIPSSRADHVALDANGDVYVSGFTDAAVHKYDAVGTPLMDWGMASGALTSGIVESGGVIHVVGWDLPVLEQFDENGTYLGTLDAMTTNGTDVEADGLGQLWVADFNGNAVRIFASDGTPVEAFGVPGNAPGEFNGVVGLALAPDGSVYVADYANGRIQRFGETAADVEDEDGLDVGDGVGIGGESHDRLDLRRVGPNPTRDGADVTFALRESGPVAITVSDVVGRSVTSRLDSVVPAGVHRIAVPLRDREGQPLPAGVYLVRVASGNESRSARVVVVR
jgi:streptogramin lyase